MDFAKNKGKTDEWYTPERAVRAILPHTVKFKTIWCPFDNEKSEFVKLLKKTHNVIFSHIESGGNFLEFIPNRKFDCIVSNPPYSLRNEILKRAFEIRKPFALLMNTNGIFDSAFRWELFNKNDFSLFYLKGRVNYMKEYGVKNNGSPPFQSAYVCSGMFDERIILET